MVNRDDVDFWPNARGRSGSIMLLLIIILAIGVTTTVLKLWLREKAKKHWRYNCEALATPDTSTSLQSPPSVMAEARTIALIAHGVGDHTEAEILDELDSGLQQTLPKETFETDRLTLSNVPKPNGSRGSVDVTRIRTSEGERFIIPQDWSHLHSRAEREIENQSFSKGSWEQKFEERMWSAARSLLGLFMNLFRCIPKCNGIAWKLALFRSCPAFS